jgi:uncharacterized protein YndB with AHSA1/START domain
MSKDSNDPIEMSAAKQPVAQAEMLIRKPVAEVFEAFGNPVITSKFWFTKESGRLEAGKVFRAAKPKPCSTHWMQPGLSRLCSPAQKRFSSTTSS